MSRVLLTIAIFAFCGNAARSNNPQYPALTRQTLVGTWEGLIGVGTIPVVFHIVIAAKNGDSYLSEIYPDSMKGRLYRLESCTVHDGKISLHFVESGHPGWWIEGEGYGDDKTAWINARISTLNRPDPGPPSFYLKKGTWVRDLGQAAIQAAEKIPKK